MMTGLVHDQNLEKHIEKQMGCMAGFLHIFDRQQLLIGKRLYTTKRLPPPPPPSVDSTPESEKVVRSPAINREIEKPHQPRIMTSPSPDRFKQSPASELRSSLPDLTVPVESPARLHLPLPVFDLKEATRSSWKFRKETPRLSLDSRAIVDAKGSLHPRDLRTNAANRCDSSGDEGMAYGEDNHRRSTSVIARLMGLETLPSSSPEPTKTVELRRSASESRVSRDLVQSRFIDGNNFQLKQPKQSHSQGSNPSSNVMRDNAGVETSTATSNFRLPERRNARSESPKASHGGVLGPPWKSSQQRKSFFDSEDFFPEPKQTVSVYGEIEKRLKMRGIDEPSKDLETLKQILEALQLKGLLHSNKPPEHVSRRNFVYDRNFSPDGSPIVIMKPARLPISPAKRRNGNESPPSGNRCRAGVQRNPNSSTLISRRERPDINSNVRSQARARNSTSPIRGESNVKATNSPIRRKPLSVETQRKENQSTEQRRVSPVQSPKLSSRRLGSDQTSTKRSPMNKKSTKLGIATEDESSSISESSVSTSSQNDTIERSKMDENVGGRRLLERCDKLLHSIAEITATELQSSPVSVLDSSFYKDESSTPSPVLKRTIDFKEYQSGDEVDQILSPEIWSIICEDRSDDCDFVYISEIYRASSYLPEDSDIFLLLEKQQFLKGKDTSDVSRLHRKLIFDIVVEILDRNRQLPPWKTLPWSNSSSVQPSLRQIWSEFQRIRERDTAEELFDVICGVLKKDLAGDGMNGWGDWPVELSDMVLDVERLIFKDLVGETIRDLAVCAESSIVSPLCRKLLF